MAGETKRTEIQSKLLAAGAQNLREFGYPHATPDNILGDPIYREFFKSMLNDNLGQGFDDDINALLAEIATPSPTA